MSVQVPLGVLGATPKVPEKKVVRRRGSRGSSFDGTFVPLSQIVIPLNRKESFTKATGGTGGFDLKDGKDREKDTYFSTESIHDRLRVYAREGGVPLDYVDRYSQHMMNKSMSQEKN